MTEPSQRLERAVAAFVRQEFGAPIATITGLTEILIEDARRSETTRWSSDLDRIHSAGLLLQDQLSQLVGLATQGFFRSHRRFCRRQGRAPTQFADAAKRHQRLQRIDHGGQRAIPVVKTCWPMSENYWVPPSNCSGKSTSWSA